MFRALLFVHLLGVAVLFAGIGVELVSVAQVLRARTAGEIAALRTQVLAIGRVIPIGVVLIFGAGIYLVSDKFSWSDGWVVAAVIQVVAVSVAAPLVHGARMDALTEAATAAPPEELPAALAAQARDPIMHTSIRI